MSRKRTLINKKQFKQFTGECRLCKSTETSTFDVHRIQHGKDGGKYNLLNSVCLCSNCHRKVHANEIELLGYIRSSHGFLLQVKIDQELKYF